MQSRDTQYVIQRSSGQAAFVQYYPGTSDLVPIYDDCWTGYGGYLPIVKFTNSAEVAVTIKSITLWLGTGSGYFYDTPPAATGYGYTFNTNLVAGGSYNAQNHILSGGVASNIVTINQAVGAAYGKPNLNDSNWQKATFNFNPPATVSGNSSIYIYLNVPDYRVLCLDNKYRQSTLIRSITTVTVTYDANGGSGAPQPVSVAINAEYTISSTVPTLANYTFAGWAMTSRPTSTTTLIAPGTEHIKVSNDVTLFAAWKYTVTYNANGGSGAPGAQTDFRGNKFTVPNTIPTQSRYTFIGWNSAQDGSGTNYYPSHEYSDPSNITLYAQWRQNTPVYKYENGHQWVPINVSGVLRYDASTSKWVADLPVWVSSSEQWNEVEP